jgi:hypothetical protein
MSDATKSGRAGQDTIVGGLADETARIGAEARQAAATVREEASRALEDVKAEGSAVVEAARERAVGFAEEQQRVGADHAEGLARAVHRAAEELEESAPQIARYVHEAAASADGFARALRDRSPGELLSQVEDLARRQPVAFFGAAVLAGFALARFAKSSAAEQPSSTASRHRGGSTFASNDDRRRHGGMAGRPSTPSTATLGGAAARQSPANHGIRQDPTA